MQLPGEPIEIEGAWSPEEETAAKKRRTFKEDMAKPEAGENPFSQFLQDETPAARIEETKTGLWDRFKSHFRAAQDYGSVGFDEIGRIRDEQMRRDILPAPGGVYQQTEADAQADAEYLAAQRAERQFAYESLDPAETPMDYLAAIGGAGLGSVADPLSIFGPEIKVGTTAWRMANPVVGKVLNYGVSGGAMNAAINASIQAEEGSVGLRDEIDWQSILLDAGAGFAFGAPFGYLAGRSAKQEQIQTDRIKAEIANIVARPEPGTAPMAPRAKVSRPASAWDDVLLSGVGDETIQKAEQDLFGETVGLRHLAPEQLKLLKDHINAGNAQRETFQDLPEVRDASQPEAEPLPPVRGEGQQEDGASAGPDQGGEESAALAASLGGYHNTDTPAFKRWFGESKVVEAEGKPLVMYHVGNKDIEAFRGMPTSSGLIYFNKDLSGAKAGARNNAAQYSVYIKAETPFNTPENPIPWHEAEARGDRIKSDGYDAIYVKDEGGVSLAVFEPTQIKSIFNRGTWDAADPRIAFASRPAGSNLPVNRAQAGVPSTKGQPQVERLEDISEGLRAVTGAPVRQGRLQRALKGQKVAGQYDRDQGVIRLREMADFETQAHETAHSLETEWGRTLHGIKNVHKAELEALAYPGADPKQQLSEGFAEWFRFFVTTPNYARKQAPGFTNAFVDMLDHSAREQLDAIRDVQQRYEAWTLAPSSMVVAADIVSSRKGNMISEAVAEAGGPREALGEFMSKSYTALIDKLHPINRAVDELMKVYEARTGQALNIKSAQDPYRLARLLSDAYSAGHVDAMHGVVPYQGVVSEGASLSDAITTALGSQWRGWDDTAMADFAAYLVSRRSLQEYERYFAGEIPNPPGKFTRGDYEVTVQELEAAHPNYVQAAEMVYEWGRNMLKKKYEAGFLTQETYEQLLQRKDYVPLMRDLRDLDKEAGASANMTLRSSIMKAFKGSKRSVINPLESMLADSYHFNALMKRNEVFRTMEDLAKMAGPGGGQIVERIPSTQLKGTKVQVDEVLRAAAKDAGLSPDDRDHLTTLADDLLGDDANATVFRPGEINEKGEPIIYAWRDGKKHALRLADGDFGRDLYNAMTGMNKEARNLFVLALSLPSTMVRYGVTTAPHFVLANYIRDQISAWVLAGDGYVPFVSGAMGLRDELTQNEVTRIYNSFGGIMGGGNVASLDKGRAKRDINALNKKGYHVKRFANVRGFAEFTGLTETGTRLGIFKNSFARAKRQGMTDYEAAVEAAYNARDYIDFGRHGSQTHAARRLVTFLNASVQGLDKTVRVLSGEGSIRKAIAPFINHKAGRPLSARDEANLGKAASAWAKVSAIGVFGLGLSYLYRDDPEYEEISDYLKATHWMVKKGPGDWYAIPKPFELGFVSNLFERGFESVYKRNPIAWQSFLDGLYEVTAPPMGIPLFETAYELKHNKDDMGRDIVGQDIAGFEPWRQYTAQTSEIAKQMGAAVNVSPAKIDHAIQGFGASWGKIITDASTARNQGKSEVDILAGSVANRFVRDVTRGATSTRQFWSLMSESNGPMMQAANTYKDQFESAGPAAADQVLATKDENTKALAMMTAHFEPEVERLNPMIRAKDAISVISKVKRELAGNELHPIEDEESTLTLTPSNRSAVQDLLSTITMVEARNALVVLGVPGWQQKELMETKTLYEDLRELSPELADEVEARMTKKKVYDFDAVREEWPEVKERILTDGAEADFSDITAGMGVQ